MALSCQSRPEEIFCCATLLADLETILEMRGEVRKLGSPFLFAI
jgi:hypothetical protein